MGDWSSKGKSPEEIVRDMEGLGHISVDNPLPHTMSAAIHVKLVGKLCDTIDTASGNFIRQSNALNESIGRAREDFIKMTGESMRKIDDLKSSIDDFRKSNERTSKVLIGLTIVLAFAAIVQVTTLIYQVVK